MNAWLEMRKPPLEGMFPNEFELPLTNQSLNWKILTDGYENTHMALF